MTSLAGDGVLRCGPAAWPAFFHRREVREDAPRCFTGATTRPVGRRGGGEIHERGRSPRRPGARIAGRPGLGGHPPPAVARYWPRPSRCPLRRRRAARRGPLRSNDAQRGARHLPVGGVLVRVYESPHRTVLPSPAAGGRRRAPLENRQVVRTATLPGAMRRARRVRGDPAGADAAPHMRRLARGGATTSLRHGVAHSNQTFDLTR